MLLGTKPAIKDNITDNKSVSNEPLKCQYHLPYAFSFTHTHIHTHTLSLSLSLSFFLSFYHSHTHTRTHSYTSFLPIHHKNKSQTTLFVSLSIFLSLYFIFSPIKDVINHKSNCLYKNPFSMNEWRIVLKNTLIKRQQVHVCSLKCRLVDLSLELC